MPEPEWMYAKHEETEGVARFSRAAFDAVHSENGWVEIDDPTLAPPEEAAPAAAGRAGTGTSPGPEDKSKSTGSEE